MKSESCLVVSNSSRLHGPQASKVPLMVGFSKQEHWSGYQCSKDLGYQDPSPEDLPNPGMEPGSPALAKK